ncbi:hypothetical protein [Dichotomicrobium thermohalophilum]|uniref:Uncharacterized protein n=1 Tax=Dichotomicrobium thermohalophilum TaxID=933063 RepID=A0A397PJW7_9HYPH|nr:hypothetical protein [Dichotomicrobium thermohalophilum]RIA47555.1 hypothetical protein BXY53_2109 [Dichotomicrobium thermohalophilum]
MSRRSQGRPTVVNPIFKKSVGDVMHEAAEARRTRGPADALAPEAETAAEVLRPVEAPPAPDPADAAEWPMPVEQFRNGNFLHCGDVVLTSRMGSFFSFLSRKIDSSDFAHTALVFATKRSEIGLDDSYVIETTFGGVELGAFGEFVAPAKVYSDTGRPPEYIVGIKRLEQPWATPQVRAMVSGRMLRFLDIDDYDFSMLAALASRNTRFWFRLRSFLFGRAPSLGEYLRRGGFSPAEFICSGFVQFAFIDMVREAVERGHIPSEMAEEAWRNVVFAPWVDDKTTMEDLMGVRPLELAKTDQLGWKYLVYGGMVHRVDSTEQVDALLKRIRNQAKERAAAAA